jgi:signal transduction histidine kinase/CheY-like chemotaxis protein
MFLDHDSSHRRLTRLLRWLAPTIFGFSIVYAAMGGIFRDWRTVASAGMIGTHALLTVLAQCQLRRGHQYRAAYLVGGGSMVSIVILTTLQPALYPSMIVVPLLVATMFLQYAPPQHVRYYLASCCAASVLVLCLGELVPASTRLPVEILGMLRLSSLLAIIVFALLLLGQFSTRLQDTLAALQAERASLSQRVAEQTADLRVANAELAHAARLKDEFLTSMSHELRTPLNAILGLSEALQEHIYGHVNRKQVEQLETITESGRHLLGLISDILDLAKIGAGKVELHFEPVELIATAQMSLRFISQMARKKNLQVVASFDNTVQMIDADARSLKQILVNLLANAVKFTPDGGHVGLDIVGDAARGLVCCTVWDTGIGIAEADLTRIFQPFIQLDGRLAREYGGTGLGLALVSRMVDLHGGSIVATSSPGQGSRFTVTLPWKPSAAESAPHQEILTIAAEDEPADLPKQPLVLVAEDNAANLMAVADYLTANGYQVVAARNGAEALAQTRASHPDVVLMDIQMPGMDGLEATRCIRADPTIATIPIIALTALAMPGERERCLAAGATVYLSKPIRLKELARTIAAQVQLPHPV